MKSIQQNLLVIIGCIAIALIILAIFSSYSTRIPSQRQAIHVFDDPSLELSHPNGLITISEIEPNSMTWFWYPDPDNFGDRDEYDRFLLIRLPDYLGGTANDASAFRAYSAIDPSSHCLVKYWPQEGRRRIEDPCGGNTYEPVNGHALQIGGNPVLVSENLGLPYVMISSDKNGYLYVEPPIWTEDKNGVIGIGRKISEQEIKSTNEFIISREKQINEALTSFSIPDQLSTGHKLNSINNDGIRTYHAEYVHPDSTQSTILLYYEYCNCTKSKELLADAELTRTESQLLELDNIPIVAYPNKVNYVNHDHDDYVFIFYNKGFKISLYTDQKLQPGLNLVKELLDYESKKIQDKKISANYDVPEDFGVSITVNGLTTLDTQKNLYKPDLCSPPKEFKLDLLPQEKQQIWQSVKDNNFFALDDFSNKCGALENCVHVLPRIVVSLNITGNGKTHSVTHDNSYIKKQYDNFDRFENILKTLDNMTLQRNELNNFTGPRCGLL